MTADTIKHGEPRFDVLRPGVFDPADFEVVDYLDANDAGERGLSKAFREDLATYALSDRWEIMDEPGDIAVCDHCGHRGLRYLGIVRRLSTGDFYVFGSSCASRANLVDRAEFKLVQLRGEAIARREREMLREAAGHYLNANEDIRTFLLSIDRGEHGEPQDSFHFVNSLDRALTKYGELTPKQAAGLRKVIAARPGRDQRQAEWEAQRAEREANKGPAPTGRVGIVGEVVSVKTLDGYMRDQVQFKMVIRLDNGSAVWLTVPRVIEDACMADNYRRQDQFRAELKARLEAMTVEEKVAELDNRSNQPVEKFEWLGLADWLHGKRITLTATFEVSDRDEHFAFGKRPTGARIIEEER